MSRPLGARPQALQDEGLFDCVRGLTPRETQVFRLMLRGFHDKDIAVHLQIRYSTVRNHARAVYRHFCVAGRLELMALFTEIPDSEDERDACILRIAVP